MKSPRLCLRSNKSFRRRALTIKEEWVRARQQQRHVPGRLGQEYRRIWNQVCGISRRDQAWRWANSVPSPGGRHSKSDPYTQRCRPVVRSCWRPLFMFPRRLPLLPPGGSTMSSTHRFSAEQSNRISVLSWIVSDVFTFLFHVHGTRVWIMAVSNRERSVQYLLDNLARDEFKLWRTRLQCFGNRSSWNANDRVERANSTLKLTLVLKAYKKNFSDVISPQTPSFESGVVRPPTNEVCSPLADGRRSPTRCCFVSVFCLRPPSVPFLLCYRGILVWLVWNGEEEQGAFFFSYCCLWSTCCLGARSGRLSASSFLTRTEKAQRHCALRSPVYTSSTGGHKHRAMTRRERWKKTGKYWEKMLRSHVLSSNKRPEPCESWHVVFSETRHFIFVVKLCIPRLLRFQPKLCFQISNRAREVCVWSTQCALVALRVSGRWSGTPCHKKTWK